MGFPGSYSMGSNIKLLVTNGETVFKILTLRTCQKVVKLRVGKLWIVRKFKYWGEIRTRYQPPRTHANEENPFRLVRRRGNLGHFGLESYICKFHNQKIMLPEIDNSDFENEICVFCLK